ncbi:hypothetical protein AAG570_006302 [Ranatra chinensis]|uniref:Uncharacterized protein n=1 Tax=Ranatra chinensis TaxID=642074 RepID=A0ABD0YTP4_9HEMI
MLVSGPFWNRFDLKPPTVTSYTLLTTNPSNYGPPSWRRMTSPDGGEVDYLLGKPETVNVTDMNDVLSEVRKEETIRVSCVNDGLLFNEDLGEVLSRDHFNAETKKDSADCDFIKKIVSPIKLASFVKRESRLRKSDLDSAITRRLDSKRWKELRTYIANNLTKLSKLKDSDAVNILLKTVKEKVEKMIMPS